MTVWDERYSREEYVYGRSPNSFLVDMVKYLPKRGRVLCLGAGEGRNAVFLATLGFDVWALDSSVEGLTKARRLAEEKLVNINVIHADLERFRFEEDSWDGIISIFCHLPTSIRRRVHQDAVKSLKSGGGLIVEAYNPRQLTFGTGGPKSEELLYSLNLLKDDFYGLNIMHATELEREVNEGTLHTGSASVTQFVARKD